MMAHIQKLDAYTAASGQIFAKALVKSAEQRAAVATEHASQRVAYKTEIGRKAREGARLVTQLAVAGGESNMALAELIQEETGKLNEIILKDAADQSAKNREQEARRDEQDDADHKAKVEALKKGAPAPVDTQARTAEKLQLARQTEEAKREADEAERRRDEQLKAMKARRDAKLARMRAKKQGTKSSLVG